MLTSLDISLGPVVKSLIDEFGKVLTFVVGGDNAYDPVTGITDQDNRTTVQVKGSPPAPVRRAYGADEPARDSECKTYIAASGLTFNPEPGLVVIIDSIRWQTVEVSPVYTGEQVAAYGLLLKREG
jgi:hypothetical protein